VRDVREERERDRERQRERQRERELSACMLAHKHNEMEETKETEKIERR
jgi:hypothetical protein